MMKKKNKFPWFDLLFVGIGVGLGCFWANYTLDDIYIAAGGELILLACGNMLVNRQISVLSKTLLALGVLIPFISAFLAPLYYEKSRWFLSNGFWAMFGLGLIPGIVVFFLGIFLFTELDKKSRKIPSKDPTWIKFIGILMRIGTFVTISTMAVGEWNIFTMSSVYAGIFLFLLAVVLTIPYRFESRWRAAGYALLFLGVSAFLVTLLVWWKGEGRVSFDEALAGFIPGLIVAIAGVFLSRNGKRWE